jgi:hypothetical protein
LLSGLINKKNNYKKKKNKGGEGGIKTSVHGANAPEGG